MPWRDRVMLRNAGAGPDGYDAESHPTELPSMPTQRLTSLLLAAPALLLGGCGLPRPDTHALLQVTAASRFALDGRPVGADALTQAFDERQVPGTELLVEISASPQADIHAVQTAVRDSRLAHAEVAFVRAAATR